jgi:hypothetical protein
VDGLLSRGGECSLGGLGELSGEHCWFCLVSVAVMGCSCSSIQIVPSKNFRAVTRPTKFAASLIGRRTAVSAVDRTKNSAPETE